MASRDTYDINRSREILEQAGIKVTPQRLEILRELMAGAGHLSAEDICKRLHKRMPTVAVDTVYRTLATFDDLGITRKLHLSQKRNLFDANLSPHHHFICDSCSKVEDVYWPAFDESSLPEEVAKIGRVAFRHLELHGICKDCLVKSQK